MPLKTVKRVTFSLPLVTVKKLEIAIPRKKRSKYVAQLLEAQFVKKDEVTLKDIHDFWHNLAKRCPKKTGKTALELQREDRLSH